MSDPSFERAKEIHTRVTRAINLTNEACAILRQAYELAIDDYDHNADKLDHILGALGLVVPAMVTEETVWRGIARARRES